MNVRTIMVIGLALICGSSAAWGVNALRGKREANKEQVKSLPVVVAAVDIPRGTSLKAELVRVQPWPEHLLPKDTVTKVEEILDRVVLTPLATGEPILAGKVGEMGVGAASLVRPGMRAYTIHTPTLSSGVGGFVLPGNRVDVLLTVTNRQDCDETGGGVTTTLLQNVEILAAGQRLNQSEKKGDARNSLRSVTLLVTPAMAAKLSLAQDTGTLHLSLRNDSDTSITETDPVTVKHLRFLQEAVVSTGSDEGEEKQGSSFGKAVQAMLSWTKAQPPVSVVETGESPQEPLRIRTLRGNTTGVVYLPAPRRAAGRVDRVAAGNIP